ncbi:hypothetical protein M422DRAFT_25443 [Sphaerobolus stellatus SS14]|nr:hypothetical protein M422DRAFT_25443 [Sphaerobolus stellatus SS14]
MAPADIILATLNYSTFPPEAKPFFKATTVAGEPKTNITTVPKEIEVENIRGKEDQYSLDTTGFKFIKHKSAVVDFTDEDEIKQRYYAESIEVLKKHTGANRVVIFDHTIRRHRPGSGEDTESNRGPALRVHVDQSPSAATNRVIRHVPELADELLKHRYQIINLWRPIHHTAFESPLALCDYKSINLEQDLVPTDLRYPDRNGEIYTVNYNPDHKWKYLKDMSLEEAVLIKCADSKADGVARLTPHTAFVDPTSPKDAPPRESIEVRALVFYDDLPN